jgi:hypothetical protein
MGTFDTWLAVLGSVVAVGLAGVLYAAHRGRRRWGKIPSSIEAGEGAYRAGEVQQERHRGTPSAVSTAGIAGVTWGAITLLVFVPAGGLLTLMSADGNAGLLGLFAGAVTLSGLVFGIGVAVAAFRLVRRSEEAVRHGATIARFGYVHHAVVWLGFSVAVLILDGNEALAATALLAIPCGIGTFVSFLMSQACAAGLEVERQENERLQAAAI